MIFTSNGIVKKTSSSIHDSVRLSLLQLCILVVVVVIVGCTITTPVLGFIGEDTSSRLLFTAQIASSKEAFLTKWQTTYNLDSSRINITSILGNSVMFFISGDGRCSLGGMLGGRSMKPAAGPAGVVEQRGMTPMSSFSFGSSLSIPASWLPTTTPGPTTATTAATLPPTTGGGSSSMGSFSMPSGMSVPSSAMGMSSGSLPSGSMPSSFSMGSMSMPSMGSMSGSMSSDPCFPTSEHDMGLLGWYDVQLMLQHQLTAQDLYNNLDILEIWTNTTTPSGTVSPGPTNPKLTYRLVADEGGVMYPRVGRVEVQIGSGAMWGTVCSNETISNDVAVALCNTMFPGTTVASTYYSSGGRGFIGMQAPYVHNGLVKGRSLFTTMYKLNTCTHMDDLGLVCGSNVTVDTKSAPDSDVSEFTYNYSGTLTFPAAIEMVTSGSIVASNVLMLDTKTFDGLSKFAVLAPIPFSQRDMEWIMQSTSPWRLAMMGITHVMGSKMIVPRDLPAPPPPVYPRTPSLTKTRSIVGIPTTVTIQPTTPTSNATTTTTPTSNATTPAGNSTNTSTTPANTTTATNTSTSATTSTNTTTTPSTTTTNVTTATTATTSPTTAPPTTAAPTFKVSFEVRANITGAQLQSKIIAEGSGIMASDFVTAPKCDVGATTVNAGGVTVKSCSAEFTTKAAAALASSEVMNGKITDVFAASVEESGDDEAEDEDEGDNTILIVAAIIVVIAVVGLVVGGVILYRRRSIPQGEAFSLDDHFEMNEAAMPLQVYDVDTKNQLVEI